MLTTTDASATAEALVWASEARRSRGILPGTGQLHELPYPLEPGIPVTFSHAAGRALPLAAPAFSIGNASFPQKLSATILRWRTKDLSPTLSPEAKSHRRLFSSTITEHASDDRALRAYIAWERHNPGTIPRQPS